MLVLLVEYIFLTTFCGLYLNHQLHITITISSSSYMFMVTFCEKLSYQPYMRLRIYMIPASASTMYQSADWIEQIDANVPIQIQIIQLLIFIEKFLPLPGLEPLPSTKSICYQLSYPGLDNMMKNYIFRTFKEVANFELAKLII